MALKFPFQSESFSGSLLCESVLSPSLRFFLSGQYNGPARDGMLEAKCTPPYRGGADSEFCLCHRAILEIGWGMQEATWPGRFQPRLYVRIPLVVFGKYS